MESTSPVSRRFATKLAIISGSVLLVGIVRWLRTLPPVVSTPTPSLPEEQRLYQVATEYRRSVEQRFDGTHSAAAEVDEAFEAQQESRRALERAWLEHMIR